ncbi:phospholipase A [Celerinatantimonas yamalensis]|uniref:Phospholipase A1 n=1 Tax=Celerinatantimonas yamalensis TaxID=559956 RepID=A0ABW9G5M9_9GAMM
MSSYWHYLICGLLVFSIHVEATEPQSQSGDSTTSKPISSAKPSIEPSGPTSITQRAQKGGGLVQQRLEREKKQQNEPFVITPYRPNYILPVKYTPHPDQANYIDSEDPNNRLNETEVKFQISFKFPIAFDFAGKGSSLWAAYTQQSFWQAYNSEISSPFRESNYEPEVFMQFELPESASPAWRLSLWRIGLDHQSNGRSRPASRSWNRLYGELVFESTHDVFSIKPWYRFPESRQNDDNQHIEKYYGYGEFNWVHVWHDYSVDMLLRNNFRQQNKGALQLGFSFPLWGKLRGYVQYFNGYGESLIDYNQSTQTLGVGVMLTNWL